MLETFRKRTNNIAFTILILLIVAVMAMFGIDMSDRNGGAGRAAAFVNGEPITQAEFQQELQARLQQYQQILGAQYDERLIMQLRLPQQTLRQLIQYKLLAQQASQMGIVVPDEELASHIRSLPYFQVDGKFDASLYQRLPNKGFEERRQRERLQVMRLQDYLQKRIRLSPSEAQRNYNLSESKIELKFAAIDLAQLSKTVRPTPNEVAAVLGGDESKLREYYTAHTADFTRPGQAHLYQIRVGLPFQASDAKKKEALAKIESIKSRATAKNFAEIAKENSDDEYAKKGGDRGWVTEGTLGQSFETAIDSLAAGQLSGVVETSAGYFLLYVAEKQARHVTAFEDAKPKIAAELAKEQKQEAHQKERLTAWNQLLEKGTGLDSQLGANGIKVESTGEFSLGQGYLPKIGDSEAALDAVFQLTKLNQVVPKLISHSGKFYYIKLAKLNRPKPGTPAKWNEAENSVTAGVQNELLTKWIADLQNHARIKETLPFGDEGPAQL
ncbi:MAG: SurA N-terminal domain-containing protein [Bdellovibrionales bacterium]|nr:SurA N-terminal domain-containing protein [Bdellovibrionales bacterium]